MWNISRPDSLSCLSFQTIATHLHPDRAISLTSLPLTALASSCASYKWIVQYRIWFLGSQGQQKVCDVNSCGPAYHILLFVCFVFNHYLIVDCMKVLPSDKGSTDTCYGVGGPQKHYAEWKLSIQKTTRHMTLQLNMPRWMYTDRKQITGCLKQRLRK